MHIVDYCAVMFGLAVVVAGAGCWALSKRHSWSQDAFQIAGVMAVVSLGLGLFAPSKPKDPAEELRLQQAAYEAEMTQTAAAQQKARDSQILDKMGDCDEAIQAKLKFPGSYSKKLFSSSNKQFEVADGWVIQQAFEAKNAVGGVLPQVGRCIISRGGAMIVTISNS